MRVYMIEDLSSAEIETIANSLDRKGCKSSLDDIYYWPLAAAELTSLQLEHLESCGPYCLPIEIGEGWIKMELLIRAHNKLSCSCMSYCNAEQRNTAIEALDMFIKNLNIPV